MKGTEELEGSEKIVMDVNMGVVSSWKSDESSVSKSKKMGDEDSDPEPSPVCAFREPSFSSGFLSIYPFLVPSDTI